MLKRSSIIRRMQKSVSGASSLCQDAKAFKVRKELGSTHSSCYLLEDRNRQVDFHWATANGRVMIQTVVLMVFESLGLHRRQSHGQSVLNERQRRRTLDQAANCQAPSAPR